MRPPVPDRQLLHTRQVHYQGYERPDGLFDLEATLLDTKPFAIELEGDGPLAADQPLHGMRLRVTIDMQFIVHELELAMDHAPHGECQAAREPMRRMIGCSMRKGWRLAIEERLGKVQGCAHLRELLMNMGTVAFQSLSLRIKQVNADDSRPPMPLGGCLAWDPTGPMVARIHPRFHIRPDKG